jgi:hypothetical protein
MDLGYRSETIQLSKQVDSPHTQRQVFDIAEIQDKVPTIMSIWRT